MTDYLLDANVFIQAKNRHYGFDFCPAFWNWLVRKNRAGKVASVEKIADELKAIKDELAAWAEERNDKFFLKPDLDVAHALRVIGDWARESEYQSSAVRIFLNAGDCWLIAHALAHRCIVVTHEVSADTTQKIKIPNACASLGLCCINPYEMLRRERVRFVLGRNRKVA